METLLKELLFAVVTAAVPVLTAALVVFIRKLGDRAEASTESETEKAYIAEATDAITAAVAATNQTYVDALKEGGEFTVDAQKEAAKKALTACLASISQSAQEFIEDAYGDLSQYLTTRIEAEVRKQKQDAALALPVQVLSTTEETVETTVEDVDK
jgi:hypothetical protein